MVSKKSLRYFQAADPSDSESDEPVEMPSRVKKDQEEEDDDDNSEETGSDSEPEAVTFQKGKESALHDAEMMLAAVRANREKKRAKDRSKHTTYLQQKKQVDMSKEMKSKKLPEEFLETISTLQRQRVTGYLPSAPLVESQRKSKGPVDTSDQHSNSKVSSYNYIPLTKSGGIEFRSAALEEITKKPKPVMQEAVDFKQQMLYGKRIRREESKDFLNKLKKQRIARHGKI